MYHVYQNRAAAAYLSLYFFIFLSFQISIIKIFCHTFSGTVRPRRLKFCTHVDSGWIYHVYRNQAAAAYLSLYFSFFFLSIFQTLKFFVTLFSGTVRPIRMKLGEHVDSGQMYRVYQNRAAALICPFISSFFFLSKFQTLKFFVTLSTGTVRPRRLKFCTHVDSGWIYRVYWNQAAAAYLSLYFKFFFLSNFQTLKIFITLFSATVRPRRFKLGTHMSGCIVCTGIRLLLLIYPFISSSPIFKH